MNEKGKNTLTVNIEIDNHCYHCSGDCDSCPYWIDEATQDEIDAEATAFRMSLSIDLRKHTNININI
jgi:hypothetical protein